MSLILEPIEKQRISIRLQALVNQTKYVLAYYTPQTKIYVSELRMMGKRLKTLLNTYEKL